MSEYEDLERAQLYAVELLLDDAVFSRGEIGMQLIDMLRRHSEERCELIREEGK